MQTPPPRLLIIISSGALPVPVCHLAMFNFSVEHLQEANQMGN